jgi:5'-nucleotidase (lipoprotein e(P4) family)
MTNSYAIATIACIFVFTSFAKPTNPNPAVDNLNATLWVQTSVEYRAATLQTYRLAERQMELALRDSHWTAAVEQSGDFGPRPPAVILDLDETVLDNSKFQARMLLAGQTFDAKAWTDWVKEEAADLVPGAIDFLQAAHAAGVTPVYITNRECQPSDPSDPTVVVLRKLHVPLNSTSTQLMCLEDKGDKTGRRARAADHFRILLLVGDQLGDFLAIGDMDADPDGRDRLFSSHQSLWGERWFQLPNPMYGSWLDTLGKDKTRYLRH